MKIYKIMAKISFFSKLSNLIRTKDEAEKEELEKDTSEELEETELSILDGEEEGELAVDMYQTPSEIIIKTMVAGVKPEDLDVAITRDMVTIRGKREESYEASSGDFFHQELYWGSFARTIILPAEIEIEEAEASEKHGLLVLKLPKIDKNRQSKLKVKSN